MYNKLSNDYLNVILHVNKSKITGIGKYKNLKYKEAKYDESGILEVDKTYLLIKSIINDSSFELNSDRIIDHSIDVVNNFKKISFLNDMTLEEYINSELGFSKDEFYDYCYNCSLFDVKKILIIGAIAENEKIKISNAEIQSYLLNNDISLEDYKKDKKQRIYVKYKLLEEKVIRFLEKNNVKN